MLNIKIETPAGLVVSGATVDELVGALQKIAYQAVPVGEVGNAMAAVALAALNKAGL